MPQQNSTRRAFLKIMGLGTASLVLFQGKTPVRAENRPPNVVLIFCDDLGYGDLGCFGHPTIRTPNLDRMAEEGQKWTNFYAAASVCTPSRAALLTGRLPVRSGMCSDKNRVLFPDSQGGLPESEATLAEALKGAGYATACVGKWHLGHLPQYLPTRHGFDSYFGIPYSNDMDKVSTGKGNIMEDPKTENFQVPLMRNEDIIERPADQTTLTRRYTGEAIAFMEANREKPFFLYLAHTFPHVPLFVSEYFKKRSLRGLFGDVVEEIDWSVGRILENIKKLGIEKRTLVIFTSDNGPWLTYNEMGGSAGLLRGGKGGTFEGGMREPALFWWPGWIQPGVITDMGSTLDIFTTVCNLAGAVIPADRTMDGYDLRQVLFGMGPSPREIMFFYRGTRLYAVRKGPFKAHFYTRPEYGSGSEKKHNPPLLYHLLHDPSEKVNVAGKYPEVISDILEKVKEHQKDLIRGKDQLAARGKQ